jgi:ABC-2 type transport system permease protein
MATIIEERKQQTVPFVMSLPISPREYALAKILANVLILAIPWAALTGSSLAVLAALSARGLIPFATLTLTEILASSCLLIAVALVSESLAWTVGTMVIGNLFFQGFLYYVSHLPGIAATMNGRVAVWNAAAGTLLLAEIGATALAIGLAYFFQARKTDFL